MAATPGEGEMAKRGERQDVARALLTTDGRLARPPLSHELSRRCCLCGDRERYIYTTELKQASEQAWEPSPCLRGRPPASMGFDADYSDFTGPSGTQIFYFD